MNGNIDSNKLRSIKNCTKPWSSSSQKIRQYEVVLARLRRGHIYPHHTRLPDGERALALL